MLPILPLLQAARVQAAKLLAAGLQAAELHSCKVAGLKAERVAIQAASCRAAGCNGCITCCRVDMGKLCQRGGTGVLLHFWHSVVVVPPLAHTNVCNERNLGYFRKSNAQQVPNCCILQFGMLQRVPPPPLTPLPLPPEGGEGTGGGASPKTSQIQSENEMLTYCQASHTPTEGSADLFAGYPKAVGVLGVGFPKSFGRVRPRRDPWIVGALPAAQFARKISPADSRRTKHARLPPGTQIRLRAMEVTKLCGQVGFCVPDGSQAGDWWVGVRPIFCKTWLRDPSRTSGLVAQCRLYHKTMSRVSAMNVFFDPKLIHPYGLKKTVGHGINPNL
jgi:hypothetical protein